VTFIYCDARVSPDCIPQPFDLSKGRRLVVLILDTDTINEMMLPKNLAAMEVIELRVDQYTGPVLFPSGQICHRLESLTGPASALPASISSASFPALQYFESRSFEFTEAFDLKELKNPGMALQLEDIHHYFKHPEILPSRLTVAEEDLHLPSLRWMLSKVRSLNILVSSYSNFESWTDEMAGMPMCRDSSFRSYEDPHFQSARLEELQVMSMYRSREIRLGEFHSLRRLNLSFVKVSLHGVNFPQLETLVAKYCNSVELNGYFTKLHSLSLEFTEFTRNWDFEARQMRELSFLGCDDIKACVVGRTTYPELVSVAVMHGYSGKSVWKMRKPVFPRLEPGKGAGPFVALKLDNRKEFEDFTYAWIETVPRVGWAISPTCPPPDKSIGEYDWFA